VSDDGLATRAEQLAKALLSDELPMRWLHTQRVAATAAVLAAGLQQADIVITSAWLHDIGYASRLIDSGFHPLDGARYLRREGWPAEIQNLVAHHSCADVEAAERGVATELLAEFPDQPSAARDALWAADATTGPAGQRFSVAERADEVVARYGPDHVVSKCMRGIEPELRSAFDRTVQRLGRIR
jgi:putative nucleotidyltransferase with HDIG domain